MNKHTPGPWKAVCRNTTYVEGEHWPEDEFLQWEVDGPRAPMGRGDFFQADARLIAAAPDLLEALKDIYARLTEHPAYADLTEDEEEDIGGDTAELSYLARMARTAIAKAEGA
jgi:hypothetical protein